LAIYRIESLNRTESGKKLTGNAQEKGPGKWLLGRQHNYIGRQKKKVREKEGCHDVCHARLIKRLIQQKERRDTRRAANAQD